MRPKRPSKLNITYPDSPSAVRDTAPAIVPTQRMNPGQYATHQPQVHSSGQIAQARDVDTPMIEIIELPADTHFTHVSERPIASYFLAPRLETRLPPPDPQSGLRSARNHDYVDLAEGATVQIGLDAQHQYRARSANEPLASGPLLERIEGSVLWRPIPPASQSGADFSQLVITRRRAADDEQGVVAVKRRHASAGADLSSARGRGAAQGHEPWANWGISSQHTSPDDISVAGVQYKVITRVDASDPIVYIKNPFHMVYDFDLMNHTLGADLLQQPRGAIRVPLSNHWQIDPRLPFLQPLTETIASHFPQLSTASLRNVARHQFMLANGGETATGRGLTLLRQTFNDWAVGNTHLAAQLSDPLLMLPLLQSSAHGIVRYTKLAPADSDASLQRVDFDPKLFREEWRHVQTTQSAVDLKRFMAALLTRNGYTVFPPNAATAHAALVFKRTGHDYLFFLSLNRVRGGQIHQTPNIAPDSTLRLPIQVGTHATKEVLAAHAANKLIWLRGGPQVVAAGPDSVFIVRDAHSWL